MTNQFLMTLRCDDRKGIVAAVSGFLADSDANIAESHQFRDPVSNQFFLRTMFEPCSTGGIDLVAMREKFATIAGRFAMTWRIDDMAVKTRVMIAVSKFGHCLYDLIHRWRSGVLGIEIVGVVSNHGDMREFVEWNGIPFYYLPVTAKEKQRQERELFMAFERDRADLLVLARYMQVLSPDLSTRLSGRCINIHHSFLPAFKGAKPYHQAYARGVKIIGATAHYVTDDLDEGPIIEQAVERVDHASSPDNLVQIGRDLESTVLARAVRWHIERRVMLNGSRTVVFG